MRLERLPSKFFRNISNLDILSNEDLDFFKGKSKETANYLNVNGPQNLSKDEFTALQNFSKIKDLIIQKSNKGNSVGIFKEKII